MSTVLVADDHDSQRLLLDLTFSRAGFSVILAEDGGSAVRLAIAHQPDWVFVDWEMPALTGVDVCRRLRAAGSAAQIVIVTGRASEVDRRTALDAGATEVLIKPVLPSDLLQLVSGSPARPLDRTAAA